MEDTVRGGILSEAKSLIEGDRQDTYGPPIKNHQHIANIFNAWKHDNIMTADDVAKLLVCVKLARMESSPGHRDSYVDACGYLAIKGEISL